jgi:hypothetical protein
MTQQVQDTARTVYEGAYANRCLTRLTTAALVNLPVTGSLIVPTFRVAGRSTRRERRRERREGKSFPSADQSPPPASPQ